MIPDETEMRCLYRNVGCTCSNGLNCPNRENPAMSLPLPKITLLCAPDRTYGQAELAKALCVQDPFMAPEDLQEPLRAAATSLFLGGPSLEHDLTNAEQRTQPCIRATPEYTLNDFIWNLDRHLAHEVGPAYRAQLWLQRNSSDFSIYDRMIFRDIHHTGELQAFANHVGAENSRSILTIFCGPLGLNPQPLPGLRMIWLPHHETEKRIETIKKELESGT